MGDINKSFEKLLALREILKAGEVEAARDGHATIGENEQLAKPIQAAKGPEMPIAKAATYGGKKTNDLYEAANIVGYPEENPKRYRSLGENAGHIGPIADKRARRIPGEAMNLKQPNPTPAGWGQFKKSENQEKVALLPGNPKLSGAGSATAENIAAAGDKQGQKPVDKQGAGDFAFKSGYEEREGPKMHMPKGKPQPIQKASLPAAKHGIPAPLHKQPIKTVKSTVNPKKVRAYLKVQKAILHMQGWDPMQDVDVRKAFGGSIPQLMSVYDNRPSNDWFDRAIDKSSSYAANPQEYAMKIWYGEDVHKDEGGSPWAKEMNPRQQQWEMQEEALRDAHQGMEDHMHDEDRERELEELRRWLPGAVAGGGWKTLREHPSAGSYVRKCAEEIGSKLLGSSNSLQKSDLANIDAEALGEEILGILDDMVNQSGDDKLVKAWSPVMSGLMTKQGGLIGAGVGGALGAAAGGGPLGAGLGAVGGGAIGSSFGKKMNKQVNYPALAQSAGAGIEAGAKKYSELTHKAVAEPIGSKFSPQKRSRLGEEWDGESAVSGDGTKLNVADLAGRSKKIDTY
jgi:hypothetical protein